MNDLLARAFDEELSDADERALAELLKTDDAAALRYLELARDEALLAETVVETRAVHALTGPEPSRSRWAVAAALLVAAFTLVLAPSPGPSTSPQLPPGTGLRAEYFGQPDLTQPRVVRIDSFLDFLWSDGRPDPAIRGDSWSARWTGTLRPRTSGPHTFHVSADDGCRLWIGERLTVDHWKQQTRTERAGAAVLEAGVAVPIRLEYFNVGGPGSLRLTWSGPGFPKQAVPPDVLFPAPPAGKGLLGEYFETLEATVPSETKTDPMIHFDWPAGDNFRVRWTGSLAPRRTGPMTLTVLSDDGCRLWIDDRLVIDDWTVRGAQERSATVELDAGRRHALRLEYFDRVSTARCSLYWEGPEQPRELIPQPCLFSR
jgi:hypothetical protein